MAVHPLLHPPRHQLTSPDITCQQHQPPGALIAVRPGQQARLIFRTHRARRGDKRKGFTETDYARFLDAARQQPGRPLVLVRDGLDIGTSRALRKLTAARDWLTVFQLPAYTPELTPAEPAWSRLKPILTSRLSSSPQNCQSLGAAVIAATGASPASRRLLWPLANPSSEPARTGRPPPQPSRRSHARQPR